MVTPRLLRRKRHFEKNKGITVENRCRFKFGVVVETKPGFAKVKFADLDNLETEFLPLIFPQSLQNRAIHTIDCGSLAAVLMDENLEDGVVLGALYSQKNPPDSVAETLHQIKLKDGGLLNYDTASGKLFIHTIGDLQIEADGNVSLTTNGNVSVKASGTANVESGGSLSLKAPTILLDAPNVQISGALSILGKGVAAKTATIQGDFQINGSVSATGDILAGGRNSNHHSH